MGTLNKTLWLTFLAFMTSDLYAQSDYERVECQEIKEGPFQAEVFVEGLGRAEDLAFDGLGGLVTQGNRGFVKIAADKTISSFDLSRSINFTAGTRYAANGNLVVARVLAGRVVQITPSGLVQPWLRGIRFPNGIATALDGRIFVTSSRGNKIYEILNGEARVIAADGLVEDPNGVIFDAVRNTVFFTAGLGSGGMTIGSIKFDSEGNPVVSELISFTEANGDGLTLDSCGNLYVVDNFSGNGQQRKLRRILLNPNGELVGEEVLAYFPTSITNPQFGAGPGFDSKSLYISGFAGTIYQLPVGVEGASFPVLEADSEGSLVTEINLRRL